MNQASDNGQGKQCGTLSYALNYAIGASKPLTITFAPGVTVVTLTGNSLVIPAGGVKIDGGCTVQNGRGEPKVRLVAGPGAGSSGLLLSSGATVNGLAIGGFSGYGLEITGNDNQVKCSWLGTTDGLSADPNGSGIRLSNTASNNKLGEYGLPDSGNLISGNTGYGLRVEGGSQNLLYYNWIGLQKNGTSTLKNGSGALYLQPGSSLKFVIGNRIRNS